MPPGADGPQKRPRPSSVIVLDDDDSPSAGGAACDHPSLSRIPSVPESDVVVVADGHNSSLQAGSVRSQKRSAVRGRAPSVAPPPRRLSPPFDVPSSSAHLPTTSHSSHVPCGLCASRGYVEVGDNHFPCPSQCPFSASMVSSNLQGRVDASPAPSYSPPSSPPAPSAALCARALAAVHRRFMRDVAFDQPPPDSDEEGEGGGGIGRHIAALMSRRRVRRVDRGQQCDMCGGSGSLLSEGGNDDGPCPQCAGRRPSRRVSRMPSSEEQRAAAAAALQAASAAPSNDAEGGEKRLCVACCEPATHALIPCGHYRSCGDCHKKFNKKCPVCRKPFTQAVKLY